MLIKNESEARYFYYHFQSVEKQKGEFKAVENFITLIIFVLISHHYAVDYDHTEGDILKQGMSDCFKTSQGPEPKRV